MPPIFKGINPFKWSSEFRQHVYGNEETDALKKVHSNLEVCSSKMVKGAERTVYDKKCCDCIFPPHHHQTDCPLFKKPCPIHGQPPVYKLDDFPVTISFHPSEKTDKLLEPVKSVLANNSRKVKLKYYTPGTGSDTDMIKKPLISGPPGEPARRRRKSSSADYLKPEGIPQKNSNGMRDINYNKNKKRNVPSYISPQRLRKSDFVTVTQEEPTGVSHEIFELNYEKHSDEIKPQVKSDRIVYYAANEPNPSKGTNTENRSKSQVMKKSCTCGRSYSFQKQFNSDSDGFNAEEMTDTDGSVFFTPYMVVHGDKDFLTKAGDKADRIKKSKNFVSRDIIRPCCSCWDLPHLDPPEFRPPVIQKVFTDPKIKVDLRFKATPEKEVQVTARKNVVQVILPSTSEDKNAKQKVLQESKKEKEDGSDVSSEASADYGKLYEERKKDKERLQQTNAQIMHETRETQTFDLPFETRKKHQVVIRFEDAENYDFPEIVEKSSPSPRPVHTQCPVCAGKDLSRTKPGTSKNPNNERNEREFHRPDKSVRKPPLKSSAHPILVPRPKKKLSRIANEVSRMNLENFQIKKKQEWENEFSRFTGCENSSRLESENPTTDECSTSGNQLSEADKENCEDLPPPLLLNCQGYHVYLAASNDLNLFPFYSPEMEMLSFKNTGIQEKADCETEPSQDADTGYASCSPISDFNDFINYMNEKFTHEKSVTEENSQVQENNSLPVTSLNDVERETNFIDILQYRRACHQKIKKQVQVFPSVETFNPNKEEAESTIDNTAENFENSMEDTSLMLDEMLTEPGSDLQPCTISRKSLSNVQESKADKSTVTSDVEDITLGEKILIYKDKTTHKWKLDHEI